MRHNVRRREPKPQTRKVERPSFEQLKADVESTSFVAIGGKYGVSDNAVRKWLHWYRYHAALRETENPEQDTRHRDQAA